MDKDHDLEHLLPITIRACKASGVCYRWWLAQPLVSNALGTVVDKAIVTPVYEPAGEWTSLYRLRCYYWFTRWYNLLEVWDSADVLQEVYINIASPATLYDRVVTYTDYERDIVRPSGQAAHVVDEDEFQAASTAYAVSLQAQCRAACDEALDLAARWVVGLDPSAALAQAQYTVSVRSHIQ